MSNNNNKYNDSTDSNLNKNNLLVDMLQRIEDKHNKGIFTTLQTETPQTEIEINSDVISYEYIINVANEINSRSDRILYNNIRNELIIVNNKNIKNELLNKLEEMIGYLSDDLESELDIVVNDLVEYVVLVNKMFNSNKYLIGVDFPENKGDYII